MLINKQNCKHCPESGTAACLRKAELYLKPLKKDTLYKLRLHNEGKKKRSEAKLFADYERT